MPLSRRRFLTTAAASSTAGLVLGSSGMASAQSSPSSFNWRMTNAYGPGSPFYVEGPGSPTAMIEKIKAMSAGRLDIQHEALREATLDTLSSEASADPLVRKVHDSYMDFKANHDRWAGISEGPWHRSILGA